MFFSSQSLRLLSVEGIKLRIYVISQDKKSRLTKLGLWCEGILKLMLKYAFKHTDWGEK